MSQEFDDDAQDIPAAVTKSSLISPKLIIVFVVIVLPPTPFSPRPARPLSPPAPPIAAGFGGCLVFLGPKEARTTRSVGSGEEGIRQLCACTLHCSCCNVFPQKRYGPKSYAKKRKESRNKLAATLISYDIDSISHLLQCRDFRA